MIIYLIVVGLFISAIVLPFLIMYLQDYRIDKKKENNPYYRYVYNPSSADCVAALTGISTVLFGGALFVCSIWCLISGVRTATTVPEHMAEREVLVYRLENLTDHVLEDVELYQDITNFNSQIYYAKSVDTNLWINWFVDRSWACIEPIALPA